MDQFLVTGEQTTTYVAKYFLGEHFPVIFPCKFQPPLLIKDCVNQLLNYLLYTCAKAAHAYQNKASLRN